MRCSCYSVASGYDTPSLFAYLHPKGKTEINRNVIHFQLRNHQEESGDFFCFPYGVVIFWAFSEKEEQEFLSALKSFEKEPLSKVEKDFFTFSYGRAMQIQEDHILLQNRKSFTKLAISYGLAQSVKLTNFEELIQKTIEQSEQIPKDIAKRGKILLSRKETSKKLGEIFLERTFINLHTEILDTPEFFWDHPEFESFYTQTIHYLEINKRIELLNKRVNILHELFEILSNELNHQHSSRLEWTVIILIVIEVCLVLLKDLFHIF